jgi:hypothetical protein
MWNRKCFVMPVIIEAFKYRFKKNVWKQYQDNILYKNSLIAAIWMVGITLAQEEKYQRRKHLWQENSYNNNDNKQTCW